MRIPRWPSLEVRPYTEWEGFMERSFRRASMPRGFLIRALGAVSPLPMDVRTSDSDVYIGVLWADETPESHCGRRKT